MPTTNVTPKIPKKRIKGFSFFSFELITAIIFNQKPIAPKITININPKIFKPRPTPAVIIAHSFADSAASIASAWLPLSQRLSTLVDFTIATIPKGRQHNNVDKIAQTR